MPWEGLVYHGTEGDVRGLSPGRGFVGEGLFDAQKFRHFFVKEAFAGTVGLHPAAIDDDLRDRALAGLPNDLLGSTGSGLDVDLLIRDVVLLEKALG